MSGRVLTGESYFTVYKTVKPLDRCPHSDGNSCEQYRLKGERCQNCPLTSGKGTENG